MLNGDNPRGKETAAWLGVAAWVAFIYLTIPLARSIQEVVRARAGKEVFLWITYSAFAGAAAWVLRALFRKQWTARPVQIAVLAGIGTLYSWMTWSLRANPEEAFHFVQYGVLSLLLFRALSRRLHDPSIYVAATLIGAAIGIGDELIQWVVPRRYFDYRDIGINALAVGLAQVALAAGIRPGFVRRPFSRVGIQLACRAAVLNSLLLLFCLSNTPGLMEGYVRSIPGAAVLDQATAEFGFRIEDPEIGVFFSRLPAEELRRRDREQGARAAEIIGRTRTDEQYVRFLEETPAHREPLAVEARIHLFRRDRHAAEARRPKTPAETAFHAHVAHGENRILEKYFSNTLDRSIFRWPEERARRIAELVQNPAPYHSPVSQHLITRFSQAQAAAFLLLAGVLALAADRLAARRSPS